MPANSTYEEAAPGTEGSHYALSLIRKAKIHSGHDVLVNGATGAIGSAAVQLLKHLGANVTAVCSTEHMELVRAWAPTGWSTTRPRTSPRTPRPTTWSWMRWARAPSAAAGDS
jgi:D-arabinose 1-dehydrogenase-like Zn-dependent alcohol dehydrogenase